MYYVHSCLEMVRNHLEVDENTTVENFQESERNKAWTDKIFKESLDKFNYELSHNQVCNGINLFLKAHPYLIKEKEENG